MNDEKFEKLCEPFCDNYCRFPYICTDEEQLETVCEACPIQELAEKAVKGEKDVNATDKT